MNPTWKNGGKANARRKRKPTWTTPPGDLDRYLNCSDAAGLAAAQALNITVIPPSDARERPLAIAPAAQAPVEPSLIPARVITHPVRSGQQIYAKNCDLIVMAVVSAGAELLADGNIHVYGPLRGRALAGINGNSEARIFCQQLGAELLSIAGQYKVAEDLRRDPAWGKATQTYLNEEQLQISEL